MPDNSASWLVIDTATDISIDTTTDEPDGQRGVGLVRVFGEIDLGTRAAFEAGLERVLSGDPCRIVVDCTAMAFCSAGGLGALMRTVARGAEHGTEVAVVGLSPRLRRLCAQLWPDPQPIPYASVTDAVLAAAVAPMAAVSPAEFA